MYMMEVFDQRNEISKEESHLWSSLILKVVMANLFKEISSGPIEWNKFIF